MFTFCKCNCTTLCSHAQLCVCVCVCACVYFCVCVRLKEQFARREHCRDAILGPPPWERRRAAEGVKKLPPYQKHAYVYIYTHTDTNDNTHIFTHAVTLCHYWRSMSTLCFEWLHLITAKKKREKVFSHRCSLFRMSFFFFLKIPDFRYQHLFFCSLPSNCTASILSLFMTRSHGDQQFDWLIPPHCV